MSRPVALALSPHLDDAAFSCGGTLARLASSGWRVVVATLFTASLPDPTGFALACQTDKGLSPEVDYMGLRRAEDARACAALGAEPVWLPFAEAPHRGYRSAAELFGAPRAEDDVLPELVVALEELTGRLRPRLLLGPQAVGGHVDHVQTVRALKSLRPEPDVAWWRDFPYSIRAGTPVEPFGRDMSDMGRLEVRPDDRSLASRETACLAYASQLGFQFGGPDGLRAALSAAGRTEVFAVGSRSSDALAGPFAGLESDV